MADFRQAALVRLYDHLIAPVEEEWKGYRTVILVPSGLLNYLPFGALAQRGEDGRLRYLVEQDRQIVLLTQMSLLGDLLRNNAASGAGRTVGALAFGNPAGIEPPLPAAEREAQAIAQIYPDSRAFVGAEASEWRVRLQAQYGRIVHFATHGILRSDDPNESYIALASGEGEDGKLTQGEIFGLPLEGTRLVVLSACQTGLGEREPGREVSSLAQAFAIAGAPTILASLWAVNDESTAELMEAFYRALLAGQTKAQALQTAQRVLLAREKYHHPYHWAAFVLLGAWE